MGKKLEEALKFRDENQQKWAKYFEAGGKMTPEVIKEMHEDNEKIKELGRLASIEVHEEERHGNNNKQ